MRDPLFRSILDEIENEMQVGNMLDVGCGCGSFLKLTIERGWRTKGIDPSHEAISHSRMYCGDLTIQGTLSDLKDRDMYDVITIQQRNELIRLLKVPLCSDSN
jgi:2-polyprenyl-3-methyl-5-hydroxy-6-metoxy-1,4-benzoquinol methylase